MEMADDQFPVQVCGGANWWNSPRNLFGSSPWSSSSSMTELTDFGWPSSHLPVMKVIRAAAAAGSSCDDSAGSASDGSSVQHAAAVSGGMMMTTESESAFPTLGFFGPSTERWNHHNLLHDGDENYSQIQQENGSLLNPMSINYRNQTTDSRKVESDWNNHFFTNSSFRPDVNPYNLDPSSMLQNVFGQVLNHDHGVNYSSLASNGLDSSHDRQLLSYLNAQSNLTPSQLLSSTVYDARKNIPNVALQKKNKFQPREEDCRDKVSAAKKSSLNEPNLKRRRMETPSPLPTFKVRKEKLGDRITALQQLVSPFGKTDTTSVLHEAIDYIKFLHDQVQAITTPYLKPEVHPPQRQRQRQQVSYNSHDYKLKDEGGRDKLQAGLRGRGLCLVPISIMFPVAAETTSEVGTPSSDFSYGSFIRY